MIKSAPKIVDCIPEEHGEFPEKPTRQLMNLHKMLAGIRIQLGDQANTVAAISEGGGFLPVI